MEMGAAASAGARAAAAMAGAAGPSAISVAGRSPWWRERRRWQAAGSPSGSGCLMSQMAVESGGLAQEIGIPQPESPRTSHARDSLHSPASDPSLPLSSYLLSGV